jgi:DNA-binding response OmpR family regulator
MIYTKGKKGLKAAVKEKPVLILLDIMMPGMDGFEVLKRLKKSEKTMRIPVIMLTARNEDESKIEAAGLYCENYIVKPVEIRVLNSKIHKILSITEKR